MRKTFSLVATTLALAFGLAVSNHPASATAAMACEKTTGDAAFEDELSHIGDGDEYAVSYTNGTEISTVSHGDGSYTNYYYLEDGSAYVCHHSAE